MVFVQKCKEILEFEEILLLDDLRIDLRSSQGPDLCNEEISDALNCLVSVSAGVSIDEGPWSHGSARTLRISFSSSGFRSSKALGGCEPVRFWCAVARRSKSFKARTQDSSICPAVILVIVSGEMLNSSTIGERAFSTA
jgi:hypothetical protein